MNKWNDTKTVRFPMWLYIAWDTYICSAKSDIPYKVWHEIACPFHNVNGTAVEVWELKSKIFRISLGMLLHIHSGIEINRISKNGPNRD